MQRLVLLSYFEPKDVPNLLAQARAVLPADVAVHVGSYGPNPAVALQVAELPNGRYAPMFALGEEWYRERRRLPPEYASLVPKRLAGEVFELAGPIGIRCGVRNPLRCNEWGDHARGLASSGDTRTLTRAPRAGETEATVRADARHSRQRAARYGALSAAAGPSHIESPVSRILSDCSVAIICLGRPSPNASLRPTLGW